ncbi:MAG: hypothetical protein ACI8ZM_000796 [Crocinitomix sp.]|jgi:hypothetical protein
MNHVRLFPSLFYGIFCLFLFSCSESNPSDNQNNSLIETEGVASHLYAAFDDFPTKQFKTLCLGESKENLEKQIANMPVEVMAEEEATYFYFPADSSEMILPMETALNEFKVFLKGRTYLDNPGKFQTFLSDKTTELALDEDFPVYYYKTEKIDFKITYFEQPNFIRLHFILLKIHN